LGFAFGTTGVTASYTLQTSSACAPLGQSPQAAAPNALTYLEPDPPPTAPFVTQCMGGGFTSSTAVLAFNKPLVQPILHVVNLDSSRLIVTGTGTTGGSVGATIVKNNVLDIAGNTLNNVAQTPNQGGCVTDAGVNPDGACGSIVLASTSGLVQNTTLNNVDVLGGDGWGWAVSFPTADLTAAFGVPSIPAGTTTTLTYTIVNPNDPGSTTLTPLDFTALLPPGVTIAGPTSSDNGSCGSALIANAAGNPLASGATGVRVTAIGVAAGASCTVTVTVTSATPGSYQISPADATTGVGNLLSRTAAPLQVVPAADLAITKSAAPTPAVAGQNVTYTLIVTNNGPSSATAVSASDPLPAGLTFVSASPGCTHAAGTVTCTAASLANAASTTFQIVAAVPSTASAAVANTATVSSAVVDPTPANNTVTSTTPVSRVADVEVTKTADKTAVTGSEPIAWTITVTNRGPSTASGVVVRDEPSAPVAFTAVTTSAGTCTQAAPVSCTLGTIAPGASVTIALTGSATVAGALRNVATARTDQGSPPPAGSTVTSVDPQPADNVAAVTTTVRASLRIRKTANKTRVRAGRRIGYTIKVTNPSSVAVQRVRVCDRLPAGIVFVSSTPKATRSDGRYCWSLGRVSARSSESVRLVTATVRGTRGRRTNTATVSGRGVSAQAGAAPTVNVLAAAVRGGGVTG